MRRLAGVLTLMAALTPEARAATPKEEKVDGYLEWRQGDVLIADGQKIRVATATKFKGKADAKNPAAIPLGYEVKAKGMRDDEGILVARELEAKPNGAAMFEGDVKARSSGRSRPAASWRGKVRERAAWAGSTRTGRRWSACGAS
jgi:hypothetical protein